MSDRRWYLFGLRGTETALKAYALDRMEACSMMEETFALPEEFSATEYLKEHGIGRYENIPETEVVLRAYGRQVDLLRTLPLHTSQQRRTKQNLLIYCDRLPAFSAIFSPVENM